MIGRMLDQESVIIGDRENYRFLVTEKPKDGEPDTQEKIDKRTGLPNWRANFKWEDRLQNVIRFPELSGDYPGMEGSTKTKHI